MRQIVEAAELVGDGVHKPRPALLNAIPARNSEYAMNSRATRLRPSCCASLRYRLIKRMACREQASVRGLEAFETYASMACVSASMPVAAVSPFGIPTCMRGSLTAAKGVHLASTMAIFTLRSVSVMMVKRVISDAVPAVVLTA